MSSNQSGNSLTKSEVSATYTPVWTRRARDYLAPACTVLPVAMALIDRCFVKNHHDFYRSKDELLSYDSTVFRTIAVGIPLLCPIMLLLSQLYTNWRFRSKAGSVAQKILLVLFSILLAAFVAMFILVAFGTIAMQWDRSASRFMAGYLIPSIVTITYLLFSCFKLVPGSVSFTDTTILDTVVDLLLSILPLSYIVSEIKWGNKYALCFGAASAILIVAKSLRKRFFPSKTCSSAAKKCRWVILVIIVLSAIQFTMFTGRGIYGSRKDHSLYTSKFDISEE